MPSRAPRFPRLPCGEYCEHLGVHFLHPAVVVIVVLSINRQSKTVMTTPTLTAGAVMHIYSTLPERTHDETYQPVLQITQTKQVGQDRFRVVLSDGTHFMQGMFSTQLNSLLSEGTVKEGSIVLVKKFMKNHVQNTAIIILLSAEVLVASSPIQGSPTAVEKSATLPSAAAPTDAARPLYSTNQNSNPNPYGNNSSNNNSMGVAAATNNRNPYSPPASRAPIVASDAPTTHYTPIAALNIYNSRWKIKARVTSKSDIRTWSNEKGDGSLFSVELLDASGVDIRGTFFRDAVEKFYSLLEVGRVYTFSNGRLKVANQQYNTCKSSMEITFDANTEIHLQVGDDHSIQDQAYEFCSIDQLPELPAQSYVDILAVASNVGPITTLVSKKTGQELTKTDVTLQDQSGVAVTWTVWRDQAQEAQQWMGRVVAIRRARVSEYGGGTSLSGGNSVAVDPTGHGGPALAQWWQSGGASQAPTTNLSGSGSSPRGQYPAFDDRQTIISIKSLHLDAPKYINFPATMTFVKKDKEGGAWYPACPNAEEPCKNRYKVSSTTDGQWHCDKCQNTYPNCVRRWIFSGVMEDPTGSTWVSVFDDQAKILLNGLSADEAYEKSMDNPAVYDSFFLPTAYSEWMVRVKVAQDEDRIKASVANFWPVKYDMECEGMLKELEAAM